MQFVKAHAWRKQPTVTSDSRQCPIDKLKWRSPWKIAHPCFWANPGPNGPVE